jgi:hypothetical protein
METKNSVALVVDFFLASQGSVTALV